MAGIDDQPKNAPIKDEQIEDRQKGDGFDLR